MLFPPLTNLGSPIQVATHRAVPTNPGWRIQLAIHRAVRRDTSRLSAALSGVGEIRSEAIHEYWNVTAEQLHHHHMFEDTVVWPLMSERLGDRVEALVARNVHEHEVMASSMDHFDAALGAMDADPTAAREALGRMQEAIVTHLAHEEADVLPLIPEAFTMEDIAYFQAEDAKINSARAFLPWMLDDAPEMDVAFFTDRMPAPLRGELEASWMPQRRQVVEVLGLTRSVALAS
jgi:hemerythrin-like domain-containing protein